MSDITKRVKELSLESQVDYYINKIIAVEDERDALQLRVEDLEQASNYIKSKLKEAHTVIGFASVFWISAIIIILVFG